MKTSSRLLAAAVALAMSGGAIAQGYYHDRPYDSRYDSRYESQYDSRFDSRFDGRHGAHGQNFDWGEVIRVDPILSTYHQPIRRDECWSQPVVYREPAYYRDHRGSRDRAPAILGAIVGGAIGNQFGSGSGRDAMTVAGAALGYSATRDSQRRGGYYTSGGRAYQVYEQRCAPRTSYVRDERVAGYEVTYRYRGEIYRTTTDYHPGSRIQVRVDVRPVR
jgi:uncharacterized protein YcfJ